MCYCGHKELINMTNRERELEIKILELEEKLKCWQKMYAKVASLNLELNNMLDVLERENKELKYENDYAWELAYCREDM